MATSSFFKEFRVKNKGEAENLLYDLDYPNKVKVHKRDLEEDRKRGIEILIRWRFNHL